MTEIKFDKTKEYTQSDLREIREKCNGMLNEISSYEATQNSKKAEKFPNFVGKYIVYKCDYESLYIYVTYSHYDNWSNEICLKGVMFSYNKVGCFHYTPDYFDYFNYSDYMYICQEGEMKEISKEEYELEFKKLSEYVFRDAIETIEEYKS